MSNVSNVTAEQQLTITLTVQRVVHDFFRSLDDCQYEALTALMAPDGVWYRQGKELRGPSMVMEAMKERPAGLTTRHIVSNLAVDIADQNHATASHYLTVFAHTAEGKTDGPLPMALPLVVGVYQHKLVRTPKGWRLEELKAKPTFRREH